MVRWKRFVAVEGLYVWPVYRMWRTINYSSRWYSLLWRHNGRDSVSNHQPHDCLFNPLIRRRSKKTSKLRGTVLCVGNSPGTGAFPAQMASNAENVSIWWRHHMKCVYEQIVWGANLLVVVMNLNSWILAPLTNCHTLSSKQQIIDIRS